MWTQFSSGAKTPKPVAHTNTNFIDYVDIFQRYALPVMTAPKTKNAYTSVFPNNTNASARKASPETHNTTAYNSQAVAEVAHV